MPLAQVEGAVAPCMRLTKIMPSLVKESEESVRSVTSPLESVTDWQNLALDVARIGVWEWDFVNGKGQWSKGLCSLLGLSEDASVVGPDGISNFVHPDDQARYKQSILRAWDGVSDHDLEYRVLLPDNRVRWFLDRARVFRSDDGGLLRMVGAITDVTEQRQEEIARRELERGANARKLLEKAVNETKHQFEAILDNAPAAVYVKDLAGGLTFVNQKFLELFGLTKDEVLEDRRHPEHSSEITAQLLEHDRQVLEAGVPIQFEEQIEVKGERRTYLSVKFPLTDDAGETYALCGISTDITDRKLAEQGLHQRTAELQAAIDEINQLTYSVSHDMGSPLRGVIGNVRFLREELGERLEAAASQRLSRIEMAALKMAQLVDDLLSFSRLGRQEMRIEPIDLTELAEKVMASLQTGHASYKDAVVEVQDDIIVEGDLDLVTMALKALLENSLKYKKNGSAARIKVRKIDHGFSVQDNGIGFDMRYESKIFQPFERLHRDVEYAGTGIGLAKVQRIAERHGGRVWAESTPGKGSTFFVELGCRS